MRNPRHNPHDVREPFTQPFDRTTHRAWWKPQGFADPHAGRKEHPSADRPPVVAVNQVGQKYWIDERPALRPEPGLRRIRPPRVWDGAVLSGWRHAVDPRLTAVQRALRGRRLPGQRYRDLDGERVLRLHQRDGVVEPTLRGLGPNDGREDLRDVLGSKPLPAQVPDQVRVSAGPLAAPPLRCHLQNPTKLRVVSEHRSEDRAPCRKQLADRLLDRRCRCRSRGYQALEHRSV